VNWKPINWKPIKSMPLPLSGKTRISVASVMMLAGSAWAYESFTCGRCWISIHLAPFIVIGNLILCFGGLALDSKGWFRNYIKTIREIVHPPRD
jgi:hypothetical protein